MQLRLRSGPFATLHRSAPRDTGKQRRSDQREPPQGIHYGRSCATPREPREVLRSGQPRVGRRGPREYGRGARGQRVSCLDIYLAPAARLHEEQRGRELLRRMPRDDGGLLRSLEEVKERDVTPAVGRSLLQNVD